MILETKNYDLFKLVDYNREINLAHVKSIENSLKVKNLLRFNPILVNGDMEIIDGQNRFMAARNLNLEIHYVQDSTLCDEDMILLNTNSSTWGPLDYVHFYSQKGYSSYIIIERLAKRYKYSPTEIIKVVNLGVSVPSEKLRAGGIPEISSTQEDRAIYILSKHEELSDYIQQRSVIRFSFLKSVRFRKALLALLGNEDFDPEVFKRKIDLQITKISKKSDSLAYLDLLKDIYNYRNQNPLD